MKIIIALFAVIAAVLAAPSPYAGHEHHHVHQVAQPHPIPPLHPKPLHLKVHDESVKLPFHAPHVHTPHLIGFEHHVEEPQIKHVSHQSW